VAAGDIVTVKVIEIDQARKRIGLTMRLNEAAVKPQQLPPKRTTTRAPKRKQAKPLSPPQGAIAKALLRAQKSK
jgi:protein Tex